MKSFVILLLVLAVIGCSDEECTAPDRDNLPPVFSEIPDTFVTIGDTLTLDVIATDPDNDPITYHMIILESQNNPPGYPNFEYDNDTGIFNYYPKIDDYPGSDYHFIALDDFGGMDTTSIDIDVEMQYGQLQLSFVNCEAFGVWIFFDGEYHGLASTEMPSTFQLLPGTYELYARSNVQIGNPYKCWNILEVIIEMGQVTALQLDCTGADCQE